MDRASRLCPRQPGTIRRRLLARPLLIVLTVALAGPAPTTAWGQSSDRSRISGQVIDPTGARLPGVTVVATHVATGGRTETTTNTEGYFDLPFLPVGEYQLDARLAGFASVVVRNIVLAVSQALDVPIEMKPGGVEFAVEVVARPSGIETGSATVKQVVTEEQIQGLPILGGVLGRSVLDRLPLLLAGVTPTSASQDANARGSGYSINGARPEMINFTLDGGDNTDILQGQAASVAPNPDVIGEFTVVTNNYKAESGKGAGGIVNAVTKSGSNAFRGNGRYFTRQEALNARSFFDVEKPELDIHIAGGQLGGPLRRNSTFFFVDYEASRRAFGTTRRTQVPTPAERQGDFSASLAKPVMPGTNQPFPGDQVPVSDVASYYIENLIPLPNVGDGEFADIIPGYTDVDQFTVRLDHRVTNKDSVWGTYFFDDERGRVPGSGGTIRMDDTMTRSQNFVLAYTREISPRVRNHAVVSFNQLHTQLLFQNEAAVGIDPSSVGFQKLGPFDGATPALPSVNIFDPVRLTIAGLQLQRDSDRSSWQFKDDLTVLLGRHTLKGGIDARVGRVNDLLASVTSGAANFSAATPGGTGVGFANFLVGLPQVFTQTSPSIADLRQRFFAAYFQDDWRVGTALTLNLGVRYELAPPVQDVNGHVGVFRENVQSTRIPRAPLGLVYPGDVDPTLGGTIPDSGIVTDKNNFAGRFGIAYVPAAETGLGHALFGDAGSSVLRAGYGLFYETGIAFQAVTNALGVPPFATVIQMPAATLAQFGGTFDNPYGSMDNPLLFSPDERPFPPTIRLTVPDLFGRTPYVHQFNAGIQRQLPGNLVAELSYVGSRSRRLRRYAELNTLNEQNQRRYPEFLSIFQAFQDGIARYDGLQLQLNRRFVGGLSLQGSYVYGKATDQGSTEGRFETSGGNLDLGRANFDRTHQFVANYVWNIPGRSSGGLAGALLSGWQVAGIVTYRSGLPLQIVQSADPTGQGVSNGRPDLVGDFRTFDPHENQTFVLPSGATRTGRFFFDPTAFQLLTAAERRQGTLERNLFSGPSFNNWDFAVSKRTSIRGSQRIEVRADISNVFNLVQFLMPATNANAATFGQVSGTSTGRNIQIGLRYSF